MFQQWLAPAAPKQAAAFGVNWTHLRSRSFVLEGWYEAFHERYNASTIPISEVFSSIFSSPLAAKETSAEAEGAVDAAWKKEAVALREIGNWHYALLALQELGLEMAGRFSGNPSWGRMWLDFAGESAEICGKCRGLQDGKWCNRYRDSGGCDVST